MLKINSPVTFKSSLTGRLWEEGGRLFSWTDGTIIWDPASLANRASVTSAGTAIVGANVNDRVEVYPPYDLQGILCK